MRGFKGLGNVKEERFTSMIQAEAKKQGCIFFAEAGEGHELKTNDLFCEDISGWLIKEKEVSAFESLWTIDNSWKTLGEWEECFVFAEWKQNPDGKITIKFEKH